MNSDSSPILAIDFGTSYTVAAVRWSGRPAEAIEIAGERRVPSVVLADEDGLVVGRAAAELANAHPDRALRAPKSRLGDLGPAVLGGRPYPVVDVVAAILAYVAAEAARHTGTHPREVRLTHPATWSGTRRNHLLRAATAAGLIDPVLVPEPVAAAVSYTEDVAVALGRHVVVYDLGGGTFDTAVLRSTGHGFEVIGRPTGDPSLGGELFDELVANYVGERLDPLVWEAIQVSDEPRWQRAAASLRHEARRVKEALSAHPYAEVLLALPNGVFEHRVTRSDLEQLIRPHIDDSIELLRRCLADASVGSGDIHAIFLAGGGSRSPIVEQMLRDAFPGVPISTRGDPKLAVALGAAHDSALPPRSVVLPPATSREVLTAAPSATQVDVSHVPAYFPGPELQPPTEPIPVLPPPPIPVAAATIPVPPVPVPTGGVRPTRRWPSRVLASAGGAVVVLAALVGALVVRNGSDRASQSAPTTAQPRPTTPPTAPPTRPTTTTTTEPPTTTTTEAPTPTEPRGPSQGDITSALLGLGDLTGAGWAIDDDKGTFPSCREEASISPILDAESDFQHEATSTQVVNLVESYETEQDAAAEFDEFRDTERSCATYVNDYFDPAWTWTATEYEKPPAWCDDVFILALRATDGEGEITGFRVRIRCGRSIATVEYVAYRSVDGADASTTLRLAATVADRLASIPR